MSRLTGVLQAPTFRPLFSQPDLLNQVSMAVDERLAGTDLVFGPSRATCYIPETNEQGLNGHKAEPGTTAPQVQGG